MVLYVEESGTPGAPSLVFLHGIGTSGWMWWQQTAALADFHCLTVDLPGHGQSNAVAWVSLADTAHRVAEVIRARATHGRAHVVGLSLGGYVALLLLEHHAGLVQRAVVSGVTAAPMPNRSMLKPQLALMSFLLRRRWFATMQARSRGLPPDKQAAFAENLRAMSLEAYRRIWEEGVGFTLPAALRQVAVPVLVVAGGNESAIILQAVDAISRAMPNAQGRIAPGRGHGWNIEAPDLFNAMVRAWLTTRPLPADLQPVPGANGLTR